MSYLAAPPAKKSRRLTARQRAQRSLSPWLSPSQVPARERMTDAALMKNERFTLGDMGDHKPGHRGKTSQPAVSMSPWLSPSQVPAWEQESARRMLASRQRFNLSGMGAHASSAQSMSPWLSPSQVPKWERESTQRMLAKNESFDLAGATPPRDTLSPWLSPSQVPAWERGNMAKTLAQRQQFGGNPMRGADQKPWLLKDQSPYLLLNKTPPQALGASPMSPWLSPSQVPAWERERMSKILAQRQQFSGLGQTPMSAQRAAQLYNLQQQAAAIASQYARLTAPGQVYSTAKGGAYEGGARLYVDPTRALETSYVDREIKLEPICDPVTGACIGYADPGEVEEAISRKIEGKSAVGTGVYELPAFYSHPTLGPWGVDPQQAYQYWSAQQAISEAAPYLSPLQVQGGRGDQSIEYAGQLNPLSIWGSPGLTAEATAPLGPSTVAQPAAYNAYTQAYPVAGTAVERF